jgi:hypothetical protein
VNAMLRHSHRKDRWGKITGLRLGWKRARLCRRHLTTDERDENDKDCWLKHDSSPLWLRQP